MVDDGMVGGVVIDDVQDGRTALYIAAQNGHIDTVKHLIGNGANINATDIVWIVMMCLWMMRGMNGKMNVWLDWTVGVLDG